MNNKGMILIAVLIIMVALVSMVMVIENRSSKNFDYSSRLLMENQAALYFNSAISVAKRLLENDDNNYDAPSDDWYNLPPFRANGNTLVSMSIEPANSKIDINYLISPNKSLSKRTKSAFMNIVKANGLNGNNFLNKIINWMKPNDEGLSNSVKTFYSLKEIDYIKGLSKFSFKFHKYFTAADVKGRININFAPGEVIEAYLPEIGECVGDIIKYRQKQPFKNVTQLRDIGCIGDKTYLKILPFITTSSNIFDVRVDVRISNKDFEAEVLMDRIGKYVKVLKYFEGKGYYE